MQDIEPDMEDLLRKASENYPLKQTEDRWEEIASKISSGYVQLVVKKNARHKKYIAASLLLLIFLFVGLFILKPMESDQFSKKELVKTKNTLQEVNGSSKKQSPVSTKENIIAKNQQLAGDTGDNGYSNNVKDNSESNVNQNKLVNNRKSVSLKIINKTKSINAEDNWISETGADMQSNKNNTVSEINIEPYEHNISLNTKIFSLDTGNRFSFPTLNSEEKKVKSIFSNKGIYYGLVAGPGFNAIKNQGLNKAGLNVGILGGYRFAKGLSIETGILLSKKFYTTSGEHFSMKVIGVTMPSAMHVMAVDGSTSAVEIPINLFYKVYQNNKRSVFSFAGFSSYIVDEERNQYHTSMNGTEEMVYGTYKNNRGYFASSINLGIGYEQSLGKKVGMRFQPYVQLPVKGIGVGDLRVMSTGVYLGITRTAH